MRPIKKIVIHCSHSPYGDAELIEGWHLARGWKAIGYHYVIPNGRISSSYDYQADRDGTIQLGRDLDDDGNVDEEVGAHALGMNSDTIGVCLVGPQFSDAQINAAHGAVAGLVERYGLSVEDVIGHNETPLEISKPKRERKTCPVLDMGQFRKNVRNVLTAFVVARNFADGWGLNDKRDG